MSNKEPDPPLATGDQCSEMVSGGILSYRCELARGHFAPAEDPEPHYSSEAPRTLRLWRSWKQRQQAQQPPQALASSLVTAHDEALVEETVAVETSEWEQHRCQVRFQLSSGGDPTRCIFAVGHPGQHAWYFAWPKQTDAEDEFSRGLAQGRAEVLAAIEAVPAWVDGDVEWLNRRFVLEAVDNPETKFLAAAFAAHLDAVADDLRAQGAAAALRAAGDAWTRGAWADAPRRADRAQERIATAQHVGDWLRTRADRIVPSSSRTAETCAGGR